MKVKIRRKRDGLDHHHTLEGCELVTVVLSNGAEHEMLHILSGLGRMVVVPHVANVLSLMVTDSVSTPLVDVGIRRRRARKIQHG